MCFFTVILIEIGYKLGQPIDLGKLTSPNLEAFPLGEKHWNQEVTKDIFFAAYKLAL